MPIIEFKNIRKVYPNGFEAVKNFTLQIDENEFVILAGPSGCGKTTTLRMLAGLEEVTSGQLWMDGKLINDIPSKNRDISMIFQNYALYPHMSVYDNMAFGLKLRKLPKSTILKRIREAAELLGIGDLLDEKPKTLSGGQRQRVAMGRAIVREPKVFLMDEPLSNLDAKLRVQMRAVITSLHQKLQTAFIYVTHDQIEAMTLGTKIVIMKDGTIQQIGSPYDLYTNPQNIFVAGFIGSPQMNFIEASVTENDNVVSLHFSDISFNIIGYHAKKLRDSGYVSKDVILGIRPEDLLIYGGSESDTDCFRSEIIYSEYLGSEILLYLNIGENNVTARANPKFQFGRGDKVMLSINKEAVHIFDRDTGISLTSPSTV